MNYSEYRDWVSHCIGVKGRLKKVCIGYLLFLMVAVRKHSLDEAARFSGLSKSGYSKFLKNHSGLAGETLANVSRKQAKRIAKALQHLADNKLPWKIAIVIDNTIQKRSTRHTDNAQRFNHGKGFVIGHQWTNIIVIINDMVIPLPPIPFHTKNYCRKHALKYKTEHDLIVEYITGLNLEDYIGHYNPNEVVVLADSGYDDKRIENAIERKKWNFIISLGKNRSVKSEKTYADTPQSRGWSQVADLFRNHRRVKWQTIRIITNGSKRKRIDFRTRQIIGYLRFVGKVQLICSECKKRPDGRRKYLACNDLKATLRQIVLGYRMRWFIEIFHKEVKMHLGFEDVSPRWFLSVKAHVHWVYCAYILLHAPPYGMSDQAHSLVEEQRKTRQIIDSRQISRVRLMLTQFGGVEKYKDELLTALQAL